MPQSRIWVCATWLAIAAAQSVCAQLAPPQLTVTPLPVGSGARALGRGGAFTAVADDATAASWNPAGLVQLEHAELSLVGSFLRTADDFSSRTGNVVIGKETFERADLNYASVVLPGFRILGRNVRLSLNYQQVHDFHLDLSFDQTLRAPGVELPLRFDVESEGAVSALSPAGAVAITPRFLLGGAVNFHRDDQFGNEAWQVRTTARGTGDVAGYPLELDYRTRETYENFDGVNATFGAMWKAWQGKGGRALTLGLTFETPYTAHFIRETETVITVDGAPFVAPRDRTKFDMDFPMSASLGADLRLSDAWSVSADAQWTKWSDFVQINRDMQEGSEHSRSSPIGGISHQSTESSKIADTYAARLGTEYLIIREAGLIPLRAGLFWEQRPSLGHAEPFVGFSLGTGFRTQRFSLDFAYQVRHATDISGRDLGMTRLVDYDATEQMFLASVIVYF